MKKIDYREITAIKQNVKIAYEEFEKKYKKSTKGISNLKTEIMLSNDLKEIQNLTARFFGYITKSIRAKKLREGL